MKNQKIGSYIYILAAILAVVSMIVYILNANATYYSDLNGLVVVLAVLAAAAAVGAPACSSLLSGTAGKLVSDALRVAVSALAIVAGMIFLSARVESFGYIFASNLELGNQAAVDAGTQAIYGIILFVVTWLVSLSAAFLPTGKKD